MEDPTGSKGLQFVEAPAFSRHRENYLDDEGFRQLQRALALNPEAGDLIPGAGGVRKLRWADTRRGKGKRGGLRIIYYCFLSDEEIWLLTVYGKDEASDLSKVEKAQLERARSRTRHAPAKGDEMSRKTESKRNIFAELMEGVDAMGARRKGKVTLRTHSLPEAEVKEPPGAEFFVAVRERFNVSRAVWANMLRVSPRTVEKWEQGGQASPLAATFVELVARYPDTIERLQALPKRISRGTERPVPASPTITVKELFGVAGLPVFGPVPWGKTVNETRPGVYVVAAVEDPNESVSPVVLVDLPPLIASRWLPRQPVLYIGQTSRPLRTRMNEFYRHKYGARGPHKGVQGLKLLTHCALSVFWSPTERAVEAERKMIEEFVATTNRFPFGNLKYPSRSLGDSYPIQLSA